MKLVVLVLSVRGESKEIGVRPLQRALLAVHSSLLAPLVNNATTVSFASGNHCQNFIQDKALVGSVTHGQLTESSPRQSSSTQRRFELKVGCGFRVGNRFVDLEARELFFDGFQNCGVMFLPGLFGSVCTQLASLLTSFDLETYGTRGQFRQRSCPQLEQDLDFSMNKVEQFSHVQRTR